MSDDLSRALSHLSLAFLAALMGGEKPVFKPDANGEYNLSSIVRDALPRVLVGAPTFGSMAVAAGGGKGKTTKKREGWELSEVHRQICQAAVLAKVLREPPFSTSTIDRISPTQQKGFDAEGHDAHGEWLLEVYGGVDVNNNDKFRDDVEKLDTERTKRGGNTRCFFACWSASVDNTTPTFKFRGGTTISPKPHPVSASDVVVFTV